MPGKAFINPRYTPAKNTGIGETVELSDLTVVSGTWAYTSYSSQGDFDSLLLPGKGLLKSIGDNNEIKIPSMRMNVGTYDIKIATLNGSNMGIMEVLAGATSLGTADLYAPDIPGAIYNKVYIFTFPPTQSGLYDIRVKCTGKNVASSAYGIGFSRIQIKKIDGLVGGVSTQTNVTASRVSDGTVYQNTSGKPIMVTFSCYYASGIVTITAFTDAANPPTTQVGTDTAQTNMGGSVSFWVLPGNYYKINATPLTTKWWIEWS
ncbi:MAG: hypothetical protein FIB08_04170 [Candidatus Methanoperedens sp.]|nr:hypothetical protein [Candidatus Methanoperedens sp.]